MMRFDVVMPTFKPVERLGKAVFVHVLRRAASEIPVNHFIIVYDGLLNRGLRSTIVQALGINKKTEVLFVKGEGSLGKAREMGVEMVETPIFYFLDDDNYLPIGFHRRIMEKAKLFESWGMIYARNRTLGLTPDKKHNYFLGCLKKSLGLRPYSLFRGYTGATLMRTESIKGIRIPAISREEDHYIKRYIEENGFSVHFFPDLVVTHFHKEPEGFQKFFDEGRGLARIRAISSKRMLSLWLVEYPKTFITLPYHRSLETLFRRTRSIYIRFQGYQHEAHRNKGSVEKQ
jgi:hypothetical protein